MRVTPYLLFAIVAITVSYPISALADSEIPDWIKIVAEYWVTDQINDNSFIQVIEYLVQEEIILISSSENIENSSSNLIPDWIKSRAGFWVDGDISDADFAAGIEWLINNGIIKVDINMVKDNVEYTTHSENTKLEGEVKVGVILPATGDLSMLGKEINEGVKFGVEEFNKHLVETGEPWQLKTITEDSATNPDIALEKMTLLNSQGIDIIIGPITSSNIHNVKGYSDANNMLIVSCCSSASTLSIPNDSIFRITADGRNEGAALAELLEHEGIKVIVTIWRGDTWGDALSKSTDKSFLEKGGIVDDGVRYDREDPNFISSTSALASKVQKHVDQHGADKVAVLFFGFEEILEFMQTASDHDVLDKVRWFGPGAVTKEKGLVEDEIGLEFSTKVQFTTVQFAASQNPTHDKVQKHLIGILGVDPTTYVHSSYDAVWVTGLAMLEAQSTDTSMIKAKIPEIAENYSGAIGVTKLNEAGDLAKSNYGIWGIEGAKWVKTGTYTHIDDSVSLN